MLAEEDFFGSGKGLPLPFLLRHGICAFAGRNLGITLADAAESIRTGGRHFWLSAVEVGGAPLDLTRTFFVPSMLRDGIVLGPDLFSRLRKQCNLGHGFTMPLDRRFISTHCWSYTLPPDPQSLILYEQVLTELSLEDLPGDHELLRRLCQFRPASVELPEMHLILPPTLTPGFVTVPKVWHDSRVIISFRAYPNNHEIADRFPGNSAGAGTRREPSTLPSIR